MPHRRPINEYERESGSLYRCKRNTVTEKTNFGRRKRDIAVENVEIQAVSDGFRRLKL